MRRHATDLLVPVAILVGLFVAALLVGHYADLRFPEWLVWAVSMPRR